MRTNAVAPAGAPIAQLGANIAAARRRRGWTQAALASLAGITRPTMWRIERGEPGTGIGAYTAVLAVLGCDAALAAVALDPLAERSDGLRPEGGGGAGRP